MGSFLFTAIVTVLFCSSCYFLLQAAQAQIPLVNHSAFSKKALRLQKGYKVFSWGLMTFVFFVSLVISFYEVLTTL